MNAAARGTRAGAGSLGVALALVAGGALADDLRGVIVFAACTPAPGK